ncbi:ferrochelatase [Thalassotalea mangrovi]|uniref:Ferrochelatase n=1 Tax=Thalassotalea mangrovi TaxID=2572245 RepID=A0A4U1BAH3_9GAMM|nr:ferrochelatase [Thalassotalea mangrovi]TKB47536.1 ferrochelatase [Thalassotalea mangrovi]
MSRFVSAGKKLHNVQIETGVLLTNLGTPDAPTKPALRAYLREFLSDPRVVEIPRLVWMLILHGIILRVRPAKSAKLYKSIWTEQGSPLLVHSLAQKEKVAATIKQQFGENVAVDIAMRYGNPGIVAALKNFQQLGVKRIIVLPLYPQYAGPTTGSTFDKVVSEVKQWRYVPSLHFLSSYHDNPDYIDALANSIGENFAEQGTPDKLVMSFHGMPRLFFDRGDPYYCFCHKTARLVAEKLGLEKHQYQMTFQSRFGKAEWLKPYTDDLLAELPGQGIKDVAVISPAFSVDCLETLEELEVESREVFKAAGGSKFRYIAALNDRDDHIKAITGMLTPYLK